MARSLHSKETEYLRSAIDITPMLPMGLVEEATGLLMKLLLRRDQRQGLLGKVIFTLEIRAELSAEEKTAISKYKLSDTVLYEKNTMIDPGSGLLGVASRLAFRAMNMSVSVRDLANGKKLECKDIVEMLAVEDQVREAAKTFNAVLHAAKQFGGEEVIDLAA